MILFTALYISGEAADAAVRLSELLRSRSEGSYPPRENYHVTIHYFGEQDRRTMQKIRAVLDAHPIPECSLTFDRLVRFHGNRGDQVVYAAADCAALSAWRRTLSEAYRKEGIGFDEKDFLPHITLVRGKQGRIQFEDIEVPAVTFRPAKPVLLESLQIRGKRIYRPAEPEDEEHEYDDQSDTV